MQNLEARKRRELEFVHRHVVGPEYDEQDATKLVGTRVIEVRVYYDLGGINHFQGTNEPRGVRLAVNPVLEDGTFVRHVFSADRRQSGVRGFVHPLARRSDKQLERVAEALDPFVADIAKTWWDDVEEGLTQFREAVARARVALGTGDVPRTTKADHAELRRMVLLTDDIRARLPKLDFAEGPTALKDRIVHAKFFRGAWTWYVLAGEPDGDDFRFFGFVVGLESEFGDFMLSELQAINAPAVERDKFFKPVPLREIREAAAVL